MRNAFSTWLDSVEEPGPQKNQRKNLGAYSSQEEYRVLELAYHNYSDKKRDEFYKLIVERIGRNQV